MIDSLTSNQRRFEIQNDPWAKERLRALQQTIDTLIKHRQNTFVIGATLFGSFTRAQAKDETEVRVSDFDMIVFMDLEAIAKHNKIAQWQILDPADDEQIITPHKNGTSRASFQFNQHDFVVAQLKEDLTSMYARFDKSYKKGLTKKLFEHIILFPISSQMLISIIDNLCSKNYTPYNADHEQYLLGGPIGYLATLFMLRIGRNSKDIITFRTTILKRLKSHGERGEKVWKKIREKLTAITLNTRQPRTVEELESLNLPRTLDQALHMYGALPYKT